MGLKSATSRKAKQIPQYTDLRLIDRSIADTRRPFWQAAITISCLGLPAFVVTGSSIRETVRFSSCSRFSEEFCFSTFNAEDVSDSHFSFHHKRLVPRLHSFQNLFPMYFSVTHAIEFGNTARSGCIIVSIGKKTILFLFAPVHAYSFGVEQHSGVPMVMDHPHPLAALEFYGLYPHPRLPGAEESTRLFELSEGTLLAFRLYW